VAWRSKEVVHKQLIFFVNGDFHQKPVFGKFPLF